MSATAALDEALVQLAEWRRQGAQQVDPLGFLFMEALARRALGVEGDARGLLEERLCALMAAYQGRCGVAGGKPQVAAACATPVPTAASMAPPPVAIPGGDAGGGPGGGATRRRGPLGRLADTLRGPSPDGPGLRGLDDFRETWARVSTDQRLRQALAQVPAQAGPINSEHLVHRALMSMRDLSPDYLRRFVAQVDTLTALERLIEAEAGAGGAVGTAAARTTRARGGRRRRTPDA